VAMWGIARRARRCPKALGSRRSGHLCGPSEGVGKPWRWPTSPAASLLPDGPPRWSLWVFIIAPWYQSQPCRHIWPLLHRRQTRLWDPSEWNSSLQTRQLRTRAAIFLTWFFMCAVTPVLLRLL